MQISTKGRYAMQFLLDLCQHQHSGPVALKAIAERQGISKKYLEHIVSMLNPTGMLKITRGYQGGYQLAKDPADITVADVLRMTEGGLAPVPAGSSEERGALAPSEEKMMEGVWDGLEGVITEYLESISLRDIIDAYTPTIEYYI